MIFLVAAVSTHYRTVAQRNNGRGDGLGSFGILGLAM